MSTIVMAKPEIYQLSVGSAFESLGAREKLYAHYMARYWATCDRSYT